MDTVSKDWKMQYSVCVMCSIGVTAVVNRCDSD